MRKVERPIEREKANWGKHALDCISEVTTVHVKVVVSVWLYI